MAVDGQQGDQQACRAGEVFAVAGPGGELVQGARREAATEMGIDDGNTENQQVDGCGTARAEGTIFRE